MRHHLYILFAAICLLATPPTWSQPSGDSGLKLRPLAAQLVKLNAAVREGDLVMISGSPTDQAFLEDLAVEVRKIGAFPIISVASADMDRRMGKEVSRQYAMQTSKMDLKMAELIDVQIDVEKPDWEAASAQIPPDVQTAMGKSFVQVSKRMQERNVRLLQIGNNLYPTEAKAKLFGITQPELSRLFHESLNVDYSAMSATGAKLQNILQRGGTAHVTTSNGTDLTFSVGGRKAFLSDGVITPDKQKQGGAACGVFLPAGEVYCAINRGSARGKLVCDHLFINGFDVQDLVVTVKGGKIVQMTGGANFDRLKAVYDAGDRGKDEVSFIDIGINSNLTLPPDTKMRTWMAAGTISVGFGGNNLLGGEIDAGPGVTGQLWGGTLTVDGQVVVEKGQLKIK